MAVVLCFSAALALGARRNMAGALPAAACAAMALMYLFAVFGALEAGVWAVAALAVAALAAALLRCARQGPGACRAALRGLLCPGLFVFIGLCLVVAWWGQRGRPLTEYDEFSHWGRVVKAMCLSGRLGNLSGGVIFPHYPPGTALLQYLAVRLGGGYSEGGLIGAQNVFVFALMAGFLAPAKGARARYAAPLAAGLVLLPLWFYPAIYQSLYVDPVLGLLFGGVLYGWFSAGEKDGFVYLSLALQLFALGLVKDSGAGLGAIALAIILADALRSKSLRRRLPGLAALAGSLFAARYSWKLYLLLTSPALAKSGGLGGFDALAELFAMRAPEYKYQTIVNFVRRFFTAAVAEHLLPLTAFMLLALFALSVAALGRGRPALRVLGWGLLCGAGLYLCTMLYMYAVMFNEYEAVPLHSYERYLGSYLLGMLTAFYLTAARLYAEDGPAGAAVPEKAAKGRGGLPRAWALALGLALFASPAPLADVTLLAPLTAREARGVNAIYTEPARRAEPLLAAGERLAVVTNGDIFVEQALSYHLMPYEFIPQHTGEGGLVLGGGLPLAPEGWLKSLSEQGLGAVYLFSADEAFYGANAPAFADAPQEGEFYLLEEANGELRLVRAGL